MQNTFFMTIETGFLQFVENEVLVMLSTIAVTNVKPLTAS